LAVVFVLREHDTLLWIISARPASRQERRHYATFLDEDSRA
jgi:uncharacterized DUF497 family protein